jgi:hypothetical protein
MKLRPAIFNPKEFNERTSTGPAGLNVSYQKNDLRILKILNKVYQIK